MLGAGYRDITQLATAWHRCQPFGFGQDHHVAFQPLERVDAGNPDLVRGERRLPRQGEIAEFQTVVQQASSFAGGGQDHDLIGRESFFHDQLGKHLADGPDDLVTGGLDDVHWSSARTNGEGHRCAGIEGQHPLVDSHGGAVVVRQVQRRGRNWQVHVAPVNGLVRILEDEEDAVIWAGQQRFQRDPPVVANVLPLVDHDGIKPGIEVRNRLHQMVGQGVVPIGAVISLHD